MLSKNKGKRIVIRLAGILTSISVLVASGFMPLTNAYGGELLIKASNMLGGIGTIGENVATLNRLNDEWTLPDEYTVEIIEVGELIMEWTLPEDGKPDKAILQLHGGAYMQSLENNGATYRRAAVKYSSISGAAVLTPDYRVAPEHPYPAALEDALSAYEWLLEQGYEPDSIIIAGDSAGGGLTLALTLYLRDNELPLPAAIITMSAWTNLKYRLYTPPYVGKNRADDPYISPVYGKYNDFPPMLLQVGGDEALLNDTLSVEQSALDVGTEVKRTTYPEMFHVFQMLFPELQEANEAWDEIEAFINEIFRKPEVKSYNDNRDIKFDESI